ncbi:hypothetical protein F4680DRAFT_401598 [Xylaria scruposa]|nr:hypothetical protein F4680DRAFT_401598 [Xylaria scruposa]
MPEHCLRLLSLDGGGVRGLSSLIILQQLMATIDRDHPPKPCDYFDLIGGTSTGGIIAIMLGRLRMTIEECIDAYVSLSDGVFQKRKHRFTLKGKIQGRFDTQALERAIKNILVMHGYSEDELLRDESDTSCKVAVCAASKETGDVMCFTTYYAPRLSQCLFNSTKIWEACRATSAATSFFDPITIGVFKEQFVDAAALGVNNPVYSIWSQAQEIWGADRLEESLNCMVSIGTGMPCLKPFQDDVLHISKTLTAIATETEKTAERFRLDKFKLVESGLYYRFSVTKGLETVGLQESAKKADIAAATVRYVQSQEVFQQFKLCALKMSNKDRDTKLFSGYRASFSLQGVPVTQNYVTRPTDIINIEHVLLSDRRFDEQMILVLHGLGGMGKTQLAIDFARRHHTKFSAVFWLDERSEQSLKRSIVTCATRIIDDSISEQSRNYLLHGEGSPDSIVMGVMSWLSQPENSSWLLIFDNVDRDHQSRDPDAYDVRGYFPNSHGSVLITTRLSRLAQLGFSKRLNKVDGAQARSIFLKWYASIPGTEAKNVSSLLDKLAGLPLAIAQAASYLHEAGISIESYLELYERQWKDLMEYQGSSMLCYANRNIATTWTMSLHTIRKRSIAATSLLRVWAYLDNKTMFHELLGAAANMSTHAVFPEWLQQLATDKLKFIDATRLLISHSLIEKVEEDPGCYSMHPIIHRWASEVGITEEEQTEFMRIAISLVGLGVPETKSPDYWVISRKLLTHAYTCSRLLLANTIRIDKIILGILDEQKADVDPVLEAGHKLADLHRSHGSLQLAEELYNYALRRKEISIGPKHLSTLNTLNNLSVLYQGLGRYEEAEAMGLLALQGREEVLGPDHVSTLGSANNLALVYTENEELQKAEDLYNRALLGRTKASGPDHLSTLRIMANLGLLYAKKNDLAKAEDMLLQALKGYETAVGPNHTLALHVVNNLGQVFMDQNRLKEAEEMYTRAVVGREKHVGPSHIWTLDTTHSIGVLYSLQGKRKEAEEKLKLALEGKKKILGSNHVSTLDALTDLGSLYADEERLDEAITLLKQASNDYCCIFEADNPRIQRAEQLLSLLLEKQVLGGSPAGVRWKPQSSGFYMQYLESLCRRRGWQDPSYECHRDPRGYTCLVLVNGRHYYTDTAHESESLAMENAAMRAFMVCRNPPANENMLARNGIVQGLPANDSSRPKSRHASASHTHGQTHHRHTSRGYRGDSSTTSGYE